MSFNVALSGLRAANQDLAVTGNNIANASTTGFKQSRAEFADVYAGSVLGTGSRSPGSGVLVGAIAQQFGQGNISITNNSLDFAISGEGFFVLSDRGAPVYTRAGIFGLDQQGYIVGSNNARLQGFQADVNGDILSGAPGDLRINTADIAPNATSAVDMRFNLDSASSVPALNSARPASVVGSAAPVVPTAAVPAFDIAMGGVTTTITLADGLADADAIASAINTQLAGSPLNGQVSASVNDEGRVVLARQGAVNGGETLAVSGGGAVFGTAPVASAGRALDAASPGSYNWSTAAEVYDSLGNHHILTTFYRKESDNSWSVFASLDDQPVARLGTAEFTESGVLASVNGNTAQTALSSQWMVGGGAAELEFAIDFAGSTQHGSAFSINALDDNGYAPGRLAGLTVSDSGIITARYTNGTQLALGQVALANFANPQGLTSIGNSQWASSFDSGQPVIGAPETASLGSIQSGALEDSNVDLSDQLVNLIIAQRNYQANAKTIETSNAVTQSIINLR